MTRAGLSEDEREALAWQQRLATLRGLSEVAKACMETPGSSDGMFWRLYSEWVAEVTPDTVLELLDHIDIVAARTADLAAQVAEMSEEWTVAHAQGIHPGPFTEAAARRWIAENIKADEHRQLRARGRQRLLRRYVTEWEEVALSPAQSDTERGGRP